MGNTIFSNVDAILGYKTSIEFDSLAFSGQFDPSTVPGVASTCVDAFEQGEVSSIPVRLGAFFANAQFDEDFRESAPFLDKDLCDEEGDDTLRCDFEKMYTHIVTECQVANSRHWAKGKFMNYYEGDCEELLGLSQSIIADGVLNPEEEWCQAYYGKEGTPTFASIVLEMQVDEDEMDDTVMQSSGAFVELVNSTIGFEAETQKLIIENVPYCTAFESCTEGDFFKLAQAEAEQFSKFYAAQNDESIEFYDIQIIPEGLLDSDNAICTDSALKMVKKERTKSCAWAGNKRERRCKKKSVQKHCPVSCDKCEEYGGIDSPRLFKVEGEHRNCQWVGEDAANRCGGGVDTVCRETCFLQ
jgi:hypothetical protein